MRPTFLIAIFLLGFGLFFNLLSPSGIGLFDVSLLPTSSGLDVEMVTELTEAGGLAENNPVGGTPTMKNLIGVVLSSILNIVYIVPVGNALGIPLVISTAINVLLIMIYGIDLFLLIRGLTQ